MEVLQHVYAGALRAYPPEFRQEHEEEVLGTLAEMRDDGGRRHHARQLASLLFQGNQQRWLKGTGGSLSTTIRQGLAWGLLVLIARQAGLAAVDVVRPLVYGWHSFPVANLLLLAGWLIAFCLLALGKRRWGLAALGVVAAGFVYSRVVLALGYGGRFDLPWTLHFFLPVVLPLFLAWLWPEQGVKLPVWLLPPMLAIAGAFPLLSFLPYGNTLGIGNTRYVASVVLWFGIGVILAVLLIVTAVSDPRWAVAVCPLLAVFGGQHVVGGMPSAAALDNLVWVIVLWVVAPALLILFAGRVRRRVRA